MAFLAAAAPLLGTIGSVVGAAGSVASGLYAGQVSKNNAVVAGQNATYAEEAGSVDANAQSMKGAARSAQIKTAQAASGVDVNSGSAADVQASQRGSDALDIETILHNADLSAYGYRTQQQNFETQATQDEVGGLLKGTSSLIESAPSLSFKWGATPPAANSDVFTGLGPVVSGG